MAKVYRSAKAQEIDTRDASRLVFILSTIVRTLEGASFEERLTALEEAQQHDD